MLEESLKIKGESLSDVVAIVNSAPLGSSISEPNMAVISGMASAHLIAWTSRNIYFWGNAPSMEIINLRPQEWQKHRWRELRRELGIGIGKKAPTVEKAAKNSVGMRKLPKFLERKGTARKQSQAAKGRK